MWGSPLLVSAALTQLLQVHHFSKRLWASLLAECLGLAIFQIYGGSANDEVAAFGNGITLAILSECL